jgi:glycine C-acetyltransferase/8-amino-7-oxononanoate synthase
MSVANGQTLDSPPGPEVTIGNRRYAYFGGTGYLDIQRRPELAVAADQAMRRYGLHPATSRLGFGESPPLIEAEQEAAQFFGAEAAWLLPSGWVGASVLLDVHHRPQDRLFLDGDAHFALREAARLIGRPATWFDHRDPDSLRDRLRAELQPGERPVVLTDGVFPISGRLAPLPAYLEVLEEYADARIVVDDAHGFGVLGPNGRGTLEFQGKWSHPRLLVTGTASKAIGGYGGLIPGTAAAIRHLRATSPWQAGSTPLPAPVTAATAAALRIARTEPHLRTQLARNVATVRAGLRGLGLAVEDLPTPIIPLVAGDGAAMQRLHDALRADGVLVPYLSRYTGLGPHGALRIAVFATHDPQQIKTLLDGLRRHL